MRTIFLELPFPPSLNSSKMGGYRLASKHRRYMEDVRQFAGCTFDELKPMEGRLHVTYRFYRKDHRSYDIQNFTKQLDDSLSGLIWKDDSQIDRALLIRCPVMKGTTGWVHVYIEEVS